MTQFAAFGLPETLLKALTKIGFNEPTPIQAQSIPHAMNGRDVLGSASTGTGKTAAFALPMINHLIKSPGSSALIMTPTRELAVQVLSTIMPLLLMHREITTACLIGGEGMGKQYAQLDRNPRIIVGTPGRINDHLSRRSLNLSNADFLILDETDRMLDMGFGVQIEKIIPLMAKKRQTLMFSATLPHEIVKMSSRYLVNPERVSVGSATQPAINIKQEVIKTTDADKYKNLLEQLEKREGSIIIFARTKHGTDRLARRLCDAGHHADAIHGDLQQRRRDRVIHSFRDQKFRILVATDVAARGLDIPHIEHVINYDLPQCPEDYIHRIGRTARAGATGEAVNLVTPSEGGKWNAIQRLINPSEAHGQDNEGEGRNSNRRSSRPGQSRKRFDRNSSNGNRYDRKGRSDRNDRGEGRSFEKKADWKPRERNEGEQRPRPEFKKEWKPRDRADGDQRQKPEFKKEWKPRNDRADGEQRPRSEFRPERKKEWKPRDRADGDKRFSSDRKPEFKKEWKPRDRADGDKRFSSDRKPEFKKEWKPRDRADGEQRPRSEFKKEWKPRNDRADGEQRPRSEFKPERKKEWKPRENGGGENRGNDRGNDRGEKRNKHTLGKKKNFRFKAHTRKPARSTEAA